MRSKMSYTVFGFRSGFLSTAKLHIDSFKRKAELMPLPLNERMMHGYAVESEGFDFLERRFGSGFENFVLLNDVAIEACRELNIRLGEQVGTIERDEMGGLAINLFAWEYWTESLATATDSKIG